MQNESILKNAISATYFRRQVDVLSKNLLNYPETAETNLSTQTSQDSSCFFKYTNYKNPVDGEDNLISYCFILFLSLKI